MSTLAFEGLPDKLTALLFKDVANCAEIRQLVVTAKVEPEFAFVNAATVPGLLPLRLAAHKALTYQARGRLLTKTLHAELVYNLSGSKHIGESLKRFGVSDDTCHLLVARFNAEPPDVDYVRGLVKGQEMPLADLGMVADRDLITKVFKVSEQELGIGGLEEAVASRIAARDC